MVRFEFNTSDLEDKFDADCFANIIIEKPKGHDHEISEEISLMRTYLLARGYPEELINKYILVV